MQTVLVANIKGGCGKTTIATHLAAALAGMGHKTALADVDRQRSSLGWLDRRPPQTAKIRGLDWVKEIEEPPKKIDRLVIDAPAAMKLKQVETLIKRADVIVLPVLPSAFDESATERFLGRIEELKPIRKERTRVAIVGNRLRARTRAAAKLDTFLSGLNQSIAARIRDSAVYPDVAEAGISLFDISLKRVAALKEDWAPLLAAVEAD